jgi:molybdopterin synthase sulfur carrier subunit
VPVNITVRYFAILKEERGQASEQIKTSAADLAGLFAELSAKHHFSLVKEQLRVAVNDCFVDWHDPVSEGTQVVFIPPVAGG